MLGIFKMIVYFLLSINSFVTRNGFLEIGIPNTPKFKQDSGLSNDDVLILFGFKENT